MFNHVNFTKLILQKHLLTSTSLILSTAFSGNPYLRSNSLLVYRLLQLINVPMASQSRILLSHLPFCPRLTTFKSHEFQCSFSSSLHDVNYDKCNGSLSDWLEIAIVDDVRLSLINHSAKFLNIHKAELVLFFKNDLKK